MSEDDNESLAIELFHISLLSGGSSLAEALEIERALFGSDLVEAMLKGHVPSVALEQKDNKNHVWTVYGKLEVADFPNVRRS